MDLEIGNPDFVEKGGQTDFPNKIKRGKHRGKLQVAHDRIVSGKGFQYIKETISSSRPNLFHSNKPPVKFDQLVKDKIQQHELPSPKELLERVSPVTRRLIEQLFAKLGDEGLGLNPNKYLKLLSKMFPLAITFTETFSDKAKEMPIPEVQEKVMGEIKELAISLGKSTGGKEVKELIAQLPTLMKKPGEFQKVIKMITESFTKSEVSTTSKQAPLVPKGQIKILKNLVKLLSTVHAFPTKNRSQVFQVLTSSNVFTQPQTSSPTIKVSPQVKMFTQDLSQSIVKILTDAKIPIHPKQSGEYLSKSFEQVIVSGVILGKMLADSGDGKAIKIEEVETEKMFQLEIAKDLKIIDQFPFSLFALLTPFEQRERDQSEVLKQAKAATMQLVRLLIRLVIMLVAIQTGGQKIGKGGVKLMLNEYRDYILNILDDLTFSFNKISELFGVQVKQSLEYLTTSKKALKDGDHEVFWKNAFTLFSEKSDIKSFLEEVRDAEPLYDAINSLLTSEEIDPSLIRM